MTRQLKIRLGKYTLIGACLIPLAVMFFTLATKPPADPYKLAAHVTGENALRLLVLTLAVTPFRLITGIRTLGPFRRNLGVLCFVYAFFHVLSYMWLEAGFSFSYLLEDIADRRYITAGFAAFVMMVPLAVTSYNAAIRWITPERWCKLHRLFYPLSIAAAIHFLWLKRGDNLTEPLIYLGIIIFLLAVRVFYWMLKRTRRLAPSS